MPDKEKVQANLDAARKLAQMMASVSVSLGSLSLALLAYTRNKGIISAEAQYGIQIVGVLFIYCASVSVDWFVDSFQEDEMDAIACVDTMLASAKTKKFLGHNQIYERMLMFSGGYLTFSLACCALILFTPVVYLWKDGAFIQNTIAWASGILVSLLIFIKMMTHTVNWWRYIMLLTLVAYAVLTLYIGVFNAK